MTTNRWTLAFNDIQAYLAIATALASLGILPKPWQKTLGVASSLAWLARRI